MVVLNLSEFERDANPPMSRTLTGTPAIMPPIEARLGGRSMAGSTKNKLEDLSRLITKM
jgi:hypothetical protein